MAKMQLLCFVFKGVFQEASTSSNVPKGPLELTVIDKKNLLKGIEKKNNYWIGYLEWKTGHKLCGLLWNHIKHGNVDGLV